MLLYFASFAALREKYVRVVLSDTNAPLRGIKNISEYNYYIFSIFVYILDAIVVGALKGNRVLWIFSVGRIRDLFFSPSFHGEYPLCLEGSGADVRG